MKTRLTPQEKKDNSYKFDRRNNYGENHKSSVKSIRRRKHLAAKAVRRLVKSKYSAGPQTLQPLDSSTLEADAPIRLNAKVRSQVKGGSWKKFSDISLIEYLAINKKDPKFRGIKRFFDQRVILRKSWYHHKFDDYR